MSISGNSGGENTECKSIKIARALPRRMSHVAPCTVLRFYAHGTSRRSNPPSRTSRERPVVTLLSTSLRLLPPLSLHPDSRLVRIVAYGVAALVGATPSGSASIPFHSVQPFNDAPDCLSNRSSIRIPLDDLHSVPSISTAAPRRARCELVVSKSTILTFRGCSSSHPPLSAQNFQAPCL